MVRVVTAGRKKIADSDLINIRFAPVSGPTADIPGRQLSATSGHDPFRPVTRLM